MRAKCASARNCTLWTTTAANMLRNEPVHEAALCGLPPQHAESLVQAGLNVELDTYLETLQDKHAGEGLLQLQLLSSWLSRAFAGVSYHQSVILDKGGIGGALDDPWGELAAPAQDSLLACAASPCLPACANVCDECVFDRPACPSAKHCNSIRPADAMPPDPTLPIVFSPVSGNLLVL